MGKHVLGLGLRPGLRTSIFAGFSRILENLENEKINYLYRLKLNKNKYKSLIKELYIMSVKGSSNKIKIGKSQF